MKQAFKTVKHFVSWIHDHDNPLIFVSGIIGMAFIGVLISASILIGVFHQFGPVVGVIFCISAIMAPSVITYNRRDKTDE